MLLMVLLEEKMMSFSYFIKKRLYHTIEPGTGVGPIYIYIQLAVFLGRL